MKRYIIAALLIGILMGVGICYVYFRWIDFGEKAKSLHHVQVGTFYYLWYDPHDIGQDRPLNWEYPKICDKPILGYYNSCETEIIAQHFKWISDLGINFIILSYWGHYNQTEWFEHCLVSTHGVFKVAKDNITNVKVCIMIEPFNWTDNPAYSYAEIYNYVYDNFVTRYPTVYYRYQGKPLICFFNDEYLTPNGNITGDKRFSIKIIGKQSYVDWVYTDLIPVVGPVPRNGQIPVTPRFDDSRFRYPNYTIDIDLSEGVYDNQWKRAIDYVRKGVVDVITICSWNEYPERTAIEPHWDADAYNHNPYFLYVKTKNYIQQLRGAPVDCELN
jgi:hypothetical protein